jgi:phosphopantothenoylcysteine decarboxylase / phosphopantothenate---cysteine ligase
MKDKKILIGISGSIAAYKIANLVRLLIRQGAEVRVVMTPSATAFVSPLTLSTLSKHQVYAALASDSSWHNHVELSLWADIFLIAPASANTLAKMANGICDNMLLACYLASRCPVWVAPAMDLDMWAHPATQRNMDILATFAKHRILPVGEGELASGLVGKGRMCEIEEISDYLAEYFMPVPADNRLASKRVLITSGATIEPLDPVRFITNHSTGKMGAALALELAKRGAEVLFLRAGNTIEPKHSNINTTNINSAQELYEATLSLFPTVEAAIFAAAVADYTPEEVANQKIKKQSDTFSLTLKKTKDVASEMGKIKKSGQITVGFALETNDAQAHAERKLLSKNLDFIVLNTLEDAGAGFGYDSNKVTFIDRHNPAQALPLMSKTDTATKIIDKLNLFF